MNKNNFNKNLLLIFFLSNKFILLKLFLPNPIFPIRNNIEILYKSKNFNSI